MSIQLLGLDGNPFDQNSIWAGGDRFLETVLAVVFSGSYSTGGDSVDFTNGGGTPAVPSTIPPAQSRGAATLDVEAHGPSGSRSANGGYYTLVAPNNNRPSKFADLQNYKLKIFSGGGTELGAGAYPSDVLTDTVQIKVVWAR